MNSINISVLRYEFNKYKFYAMNSINITEIHNEFNKYKCFTL